MSRVTALRQYSEKIVLFGSCAQGTDTAKSDIDLFVVTRDKPTVQKATQKIKGARHVQWVIKTPQEYVILNGKEPVFAEELSRGILLWEASNAPGAE